MDVTHKITHIHTFRDFHKCSRLQCIPNYVTQVNWICRTQIYDLQKSAIFISWLMICLCMCIWRDMKRHQQQQQKRIACADSAMVIHSKDDFNRQTWNSESKMSQTYLFWTVGRQKNPLYIFHLMNRLMRFESCAFGYGQYNRGALFCHTHTHTKQ